MIRFNDELISLAFKVNQVFNQVKHNICIKNMNIFYFNKIFHSILVIPKNLINYKPILLYIRYTKTKLQFLIFNAISNIG